MVKNENTHTPETPTIISQLLKSEQPNKLAYNLLIKKKTQNEKKSEVKWINQFGDDNLDWKQIYTNAIKATKDIKLQNFQYKFLMRTLPTNTF